MDWLSLRITVIRRGSEDFGFVRRMKKSVVLNQRWRIEHEERCLDH